ncbi:MULTISPECIES: hypothetical protein [Leptolyngbya]|uniref:hypothetical protein n=1 Tax=Leptolyngbya TaxID=47251 RepID=UPI001683BA0C|nr:hypothetical protein [Leptolyngbya sp. FACHB-1624]MBD1855498.1 hypothetical protein [Leptolyngbya sp. FACHB-1624]
MAWQENVRKMDEQADTIIAGWSFGALAANLLPPPFDTMVVGAVFAKLGADIGEVYGVTFNWDKLLDIGKVIATGVGGVAAASYVGTGLLKWIPGVNVWVALLIQPPMVAAIAYAAGNTFKNYYRIHITEGRDLTPEEIKEMAKSHFRSKIGE